MNRTSILFPLLLAVLSGCSASSPSSAGKSDETLSNPEAGASSDGCAPANNPDGCPATYSPESDDLGACQVGVECEYPGYSDDSPSCGDYAVLDCRVTEDGGAPRWVATQ